MNFMPQMQNYDDVDRRRMLGSALMQGGANMGSPLGALASFFGGLAGRSADKRERQLSEDKKAEEAERRRMLGEALTGGGKTEMDIARAVMQFGGPEMFAEGAKMAISANKPKAPVGIEATEFLTKHGDKFDATPEEWAAGAEDGVYDAKELARLKRKQDPKAALELERIRAQIAKENALAAKAGRAPEAPTQQPSETERLLALIPPELRQQAIMGRFGLKGDEKQTIDKAKADAAAIGAGSADNALAILDKGLSTGPFASLLPWKTAGDQRYMSEIGGIVSSLRALQRVKGSGAESDKELSLLLAQAPDLSTDESAARDIIKRLQEKMDLYSGVSSGGASAPSGKTGDPLIDKYLD